jgi:muconolactone delta-isomerase
MEFLVDFKVNVPTGASESEVKDREKAEASATAKLADEGHLVRLWRRTVTSSDRPVVGLFRADSETELDSMIRALPLYEWLDVSVTPLKSHANDPADASVPRRPEPRTSTSLPDPRLTKVYRLEATLGQPLDIGDVPGGHRRIVPLTSGIFAGPEINGKLLPGASADWQVGLADGTTLGDIRYTLQTDRGDLLYVQSRGVRHGSAEVLARLARGEDVDASEYTFRTSTQIETAAAELDWLNKGVFISVGGRQATGVIYETYLVA